MNLKERLMNDLKDAMKEKDIVKKNTITMIRAAILQYEKDNLTQLDENGITDIISKELQKRKDSMAEFEKSGRQDLVDELENEIKIIKAFLPEELSIEELTKIIKETIAEVDAKDMKDMGKVMKSVKEKTVGRANGKTINEIVKNELA